MPNLEKITNKSLVKRIYDFGKKYLNYQVGVGGAIVMGSLVFGVNYYDTGELANSTTAALKQGGYTFLFGGATMRGCEYLATRINDKAKALLASVVIPSLVSISLTYGIHSLKGTPNPEESTIPTVVTIIPATAFWGHKKRKQLESIA